MIDQREKHGRRGMIARSLLFVIVLLTPAAGFPADSATAEPPCVEAAAVQPKVQTSAQQPSVQLPGAKECWGEGTQVVQAGRFYIAGQPDRLALERAKAESVAMVISLQGPKESEWDEAAEARSLGLEFHRVPVDGMADALASEPLVQISELVQANPDAKILVHCSTGVRASAWFATYLADYQGMGIDEAIDVANRTGLSKDTMRDKVRAYLER